jgi:hypothetical protein
MSAALAANLTFWALLALVLVGCVLGFWGRLGRWTVSGDAEGLAELLSGFLVAAAGILALAFLAAWGCR